MRCVRVRCEGRSSRGPACVRMARARARGGHSIWVATRRCSRRFAGRRKRGSWRRSSSPSLPSCFRTRPTQHSTRKSTCARTTASLCVVGPSSPLKAANPKANVPQRRATTARLCRGPSDSRSCDPRLCRPLPRRARTDRQGRRRAVPAVCQRCGRERAQARGAVGAHAPSATSATVERTRGGGGLPSDEALEVDTLQRVLHGLLDADLRGRRHAVSGVTRVSAASRDA